MTNYYKHPTYGMVYGKSIVSPLGRLCWPFLVTPKNPPPATDGNPPGAPRYEVTIALPKADLKVKKFVKEVKEMTDEMLVLFNKGRSAKLSELSLFGKYGDGDEADHEKYPFYEGTWNLVGRNTQVAKVVDASKKIIEAKTIEGGMIGRLIVTPLITSHGISYKLEAVQFVKDDGVRFAGSARDSLDLFDACADDDCIETKEPLDVVEEEEEAAPTPKKQKRGKEAALDLL